MDPVYAKLLSQVVSICRRALVDAPAVRERLAKRGLAEAALLDRFQIGWAPGTLPSLARGEVLRQLQVLGLLDAEGHERLAGCIVLPVFDETGAVVQIAAYAEDGRILWLFPDETPVFWNAACLGTAREVSLAPDPLAGLIEIARGTEAVIAPAGPGKRPRIAGVCCG